VTLRLRAHVAEVRRPAMLARMPVMGVAKFERFFRAAAGLDVDKSDLKRYNEFINHKLYDLFLMARVAARSNARDMIEPYDLPITKGLQESMREFDKLDEQIELAPVLSDLAALPPLEVGVSETAASWLPRIAGGLSVALARTFTIIDPELKNPQSTHWKAAFRVFDLLL
jgi:hypothetical protein